MTSDHMTSAKIHSLPPDATSLIAGIWDEPDYADRFIVDVPPERFAAVDDFAAAWFTKQPAWIRLVSTNALTAERVRRDLEVGRFRPGTAIGAWMVIDRNHDEIVFGESLGFMEHRVSFRLAPGRVEVATAVRYRWRRVAPLYFALVEPMHKRFIPLVLKRITR